MKRLDRHTTGFKQVLGERPAILRRNLLAIIVVLTYVLVFLAAWLELDRTYYQGAKKEILRDRYEDKIKQRLLTEFLNDTVFAGLPQGTRKEESLKTIEVSPTRAKTHLPTSPMKANSKSITH